MKQRNLKETEYLIIIFWRLGQLNELGLIEGGGSQLTSDGFDTALNLHEEGYEYTLEEVTNCKTELGLTDSIIFLLMRLQKLGFEKIKNDLMKKNVN